MSEYIEVGQPLQFTDPNTPTRVGEIVENVSDIYNIPSPRLGMQVFVKNEKKSFVITSLKSKVIGGVDVPEAAVEGFEPVGAKSITWNNDTDPSNMNDIVVAGVYDIKGEHTREDDNLPILNTGGGHTFNARLTVLDSSISGSGNSDDKCITQVLSFSNRLGQGEVYIRTGKGASLENLTWEKWSTLQRNVNVGQVYSLDNLIDNGIYSGVYSGTITGPGGGPVDVVETFVLVVINDYAVSGQTGLPRNIIQLKYAVDTLAGQSSVKKRVGAGNDSISWGDWEILNKNEIASMISAEIKKVTDGIDPDKIDSIKDIITWIEEHGGDVTAIYNAIQGNTTKINAEVNRAQAVEAGLGEHISHVENKVDTTKTDLAETKKNIASSLHASSSADSVEIAGKSNVGRTTFLVDIPAATATTAGVMSANDKKVLKNLFDEAVKLGSFEVEELGDGIGINYSTLNDNGGSIEIPNATTKNAGVMSATDKEKLDNLSEGGGGDITAVPTDVVIEEIEPNLVSSAIRKTPQVLTDSEKEIARGNIGAADAEKTSIAITTNETNINNEAIRAKQAEADAIEKGRQLALRSLFIAAGAEYNDSGTDKTKTAPWGETVTHKAGHYYLNGLGDITEKQMIDIYNAPHYALYPFAYYKNTSIRTVLMRGTGGQSSLTSPINGWFNFCSSVEIIGNKEHFYYQGNSLTRAFSGCKKLKRIIFEPFICKNCDVRNIFTDCFELIEVRLYSLNKDISFDNSGLLSKASILYAIANATPTSAITITLHADAYARLANDADIVAALDAKNTELASGGGSINLVSA